MLLIFISNKTIKPTVKHCWYKGKFKNKDNFFLKTEGQLSERKEKKAIFESWFWRKINKLA